MNFHQRKMEKWTFIHSLKKYYNISPITKRTYWDVCGWAPPIQNLESIWDGLGKSRDGAIITFSILYYWNVGRIKIEKLIQVLTMWKSTTHFLIFLFFFLPERGSFFKENHGNVNVIIRERVLSRKLERQESHTI